MKNLRAAMSWLAKSGPALLGALTGHLLLVAVLAAIAVVCWLAYPAALDLRELLADPIRRRRARSGLDRRPRPGCPRRRTAGPPGSE